MDNQCSQDTADVETASEATFRYTIEKFSNLEVPVYSPPVYVRNLPWKIMAKLGAVEQPACHDKQNEHADQERCLGFFLHCGGESESTTWSCNALVDFRIIPQKEGCLSDSEKVKHVFNSEKYRKGFDNFLTLSVITDPERGFVKDDTIILEVWVSADAPQGLASDRMTVAKALANYFYIGEGWPASHQEEVKFTQMFKELDDPRAHKMINLINKGSLKSLHANLLMLGYKLASDSHKNDTFLDEKLKLIEKCTKEIEEYRGKQ